MNTAEQEISRNIFRYIGLILSFSTLQLSIIQGLQLHKFDCDYLA